MSRRAPSTGAARTARAPSMTAGSSRLSKVGSSVNLADNPRQHRAERAASAIGGSSSSGGGIKVLTAAPESNINVVVRCRGRTPKEIAEATPVITTTDGPLSSGITIETTPAASSSALSTYGGTANTKTYPFDKVFGPEADQTMVFSEVADNMLHEVLAGYNCTIFAYGQTGTGKTYTMQGDLKPTPLMAPSTDAGIIPRVLHRLFALLEAQENTEYAVKCSYIELYNEEVRDLLAWDYGTPSAGANIKIYEDSAKKGVNVQGIEEAGIRDLKDGLAILNKGSQRRQVAETKMNTESSRSHSVFTLTVHVKETSDDKKGEDLLRIGKFNLVDLAGSEAIGRSGAENKRAREAGMINQSLLTLGRVISALVDKGSHIPYRESKLTRLLQDSLGGRTKTCIVATVSPTRSNMEETLSTLDYALRAKSIKNKPEVNAHLTKAGLLREYLGDIERLKAELHATREKNGVYIPDDAWKEMTETQARQKSDYDEARSRVTAVEVELRTRKAEFEGLTSRFVSTTSELSQVRDAERTLGEMLDRAKSDVEAARVALEEERVVAEAYVASERRLHGVAGELHSVAVDSVRDVGGLFDKLGRVNRVMEWNSGTSTTFGSEMKSLSTELKKGIKQIHAVQGEFGATLRGDLQAYAKRGDEESRRHMADLDTSFNAFNELANSLASRIDAGKLDAAQASAAILAVKDDVASGVRSWAERVASRSTQMVDDLVAHQETHLASVGTVLDSTTGIVADVIAAARDLITEQAAASRQAELSVAKTAEEELSRLRSQNASLTRLLAEEQTKSQRLRVDLIAGITGMVDKFADSRDASLNTVIQQVSAGNTAGTKSLGAMRDTYALAAADGRESAAAFEQQLASHKERLPAQRELGEKAMAEVSYGMRARLTEYAEESVREAESHIEDVDMQCKRIGLVAEEASSTATSHATAQMAVMSKLSQNARDGHSLSSQRAQSGAEEIATLTSTLLASHATATSTSERAHAGAKRKLESITQSTARFLDALEADEPTGDTPRKRTWEIPSKFERAEPRQQLIERFRARGGGSALSHEVCEPAESIEFTPTSSVTSVGSATTIADAAPPEEVHEKLSVGARPQRPRVKKFGSSENIERERVQLTVLGDGGNIPRRRARG